MKLRNKLIATIVSISMVLAVVGIGAWASVESFTASITNTVNLEFDNLKGQVFVIAGGGADNLEYADEPYLQETTMFDGSNVIYNQISSSATSGQNLYWAGTRFLDSSEDGMQVVDNETTAAVVEYWFIYFPTDDCVGTSTITAMVTETSAPEISGGKLMVKYFATYDEVNYTEITSGQAITPVADNEAVGIVAVCQYYNLDGESISTIESAWDFNVTFSAGRNEVTPLEGTLNLDTTPFGGVVLPYDFESESLPYDIIEFGEYPQTLKANSVTITSETPDADGYYPGSDGARYAKLAAAEFVSAEEQLKFNVADDGTAMVGGQEYYFKVEPIKWRVLSDEDGKSLIVSDKILSRINTGGFSGYDGMITFLTDEFYNSAFSASEQSQILTTDVDDGKIWQQVNGVQQVVDNPNATNNQYKVFELGVQELTNSDYGFNPDFQAQDAARLWQTTDYARALGLWTITREYLEVFGVSEEEGAHYIGTGSMVSRTMAEYIDDGNVYDTLVAGCWSGRFEGAMDIRIEGIVPAMNITR